MEEARRCKQCSVDYPPHLVTAAFRRRGQDASCPLRPTCRRCEQSNRDEKKRAGRHKVKARDVVRRHAERLKVSKDELTARGWNVDQIAHDIEFRYGNGCDYCWHPFAEMGHGLADITIDIVDRSKPPDYRTNTKWCCLTCNRKKGTMKPEEFELDLQMNRWHDEQVAAMRAEPQEFGRLFFLEAS